MIRFQNSVVIARSTNSVFQFLADFENMPKWNYFVLEVSKTSSGPIGLGTAFHQVRKDDRQDYTITEFESGRRLAIETVPPAPRLLMRFTLQSEGQATRVTDEWELETGRGAALEWLAAGRIKGVVADNLARLKELLETGRTTLQDGRVVQQGAWG